MLIKAVASGRGGYDSHCVRTNRKPWRGPSRTATALRSAGCLRETFGQRANVRPEDWTVGFLASRRDCSLHGAPHSFESRQRPGLSNSVRSHQRVGANSLVSQPRYVFVFTGGWRGSSSWRTNASAVETHRHRGGPAGRPAANQAALPKGNSQVQVPERGSSVRLRTAFATHGAMQADGSASPARRLSRLPKGPR